MNDMTPMISNFRLVKDHPYLRALADLSVAGIVVRGIKLEEGLHGTLYLGFPGRKLQGQWQLICDTESDASRQYLLSLMTDRYLGSREAA